MTDPKFHDDLVAELAVLNIAVMRALSGLAVASGSPEEYKKRILESGLRDLRTTNYWSVPEERKEQFHANAEARWSDLVAGLIRPA